MNSINLPALMIQKLKENGMAFINGHNLCGIVGHKWRYKDYTNWIKEDGEHYDFNASRKCAFCNQYQYLGNNWKSSEKKSSYDIIGDSQFMKSMDTSAII